MSEIEQILNDEMDDFAPRFSILGYLTDMTKCVKRILNPINGTTMTYYMLYVNPTPEKRFVLFMHIENLPDNLKVNERYLFQGLINPGKNGIYLNVKIIWKKVVEDKCPEKIDHFQI